MASEHDPLLPQGNSAPEITGYGFSKGPHVHHQPEDKTLENEVIVEETGDESFDQAETIVSPLRTICYLFFIVVLFSLFIALLIPKGLSDRWQGPRDDPPTNPQTIEARVSRILSDNPLIGPYVSVYLFSSLVA